MPGLTYRAAPILAGFALASFGQAAPRHFDVASVKPLAPGAGPGFLTVDPQRLSVPGLTLRTMIEYAYGLQIFQISISPPWTINEGYVVEARTAAPASRAEMMQMLQTLLVERFHMQVKREMRNSKAYALTIAAGGLKLQKASAQQPAKRPVVPGRRVSGGAMTMADLSASLTYSSLGATGRPVMDRTGLSGEYNVWFVRDPANYTTPGESLLEFEAATFRENSAQLEPKMGLKLVPENLPIEFITFTAQRPDAN